MIPGRREVETWAATHGVAVRWPDGFVVAPERRDRAALLAEAPERFDSETNPCVDFGKLEERIPAFVLGPRDLAQLIACVRFLADARVAYVVRGTAHSSGGQPLGVGAVIDLTAMSRILADRPEAEELELEGGALWRDAVLQLAPQGRRPLVLTNNLRTTVGGTLAVGGFGDASHLHGLQIDGVIALTVVTPDGEVHRLTPRDELFGFVLAGRGQLGIIAAVTLRTMRRPMVLVGRQVRWSSVDDYVRDAGAIAAYRLYDYLQVRVCWHPNGFSTTVEGYLGNLADRVTGPDPGLALIRPAWISAPRLLDLVDARADAPTDTALSTPALELTFPLPHGLERWRTIAQQVARHGITRALPLGSAMMLVRNLGKLPLAPLPPGDFALMVALRPSVAPGEAAAMLPVLRELGAAAVRDGAHLYFMSIDLGDPALIDHQLGAAGQRLRALKAELDPHRLVGGDWLNPAPAG
ncbi:MAG: FAD-binding oxidoreductase [Deltaproteobacteria bacterium]|nr:FAD-binding oxidoreductase [Deltaproteobacteria bacterium]